MKVRVLHILSVLVLAGNMMSVAQDSRLMSREALDSLMSPQVMPGGDKVLAFETLQKDFGVIYEDGSPLAVDYHFVNVSGKPVSITRITTNCGCTAAEIGDSLLSPGEKGVIRIKFNPRRRSGTVDTNTFVYTSLSSKAPVAKLTLLGNVIDNDEWNHLPCRMGMLKLKRKEVLFEPVKPVVETIEVKVEKMIAQSVSYENSISIGGKLDPNLPALFLILLQIFGNGRFPAAAGI